MMRQQRLGTHARVLIGNLLGAMITGFYFNRIDPRATEVASTPLARPLPFFVLGFLLIAVAGYQVARRWLRPLSGLDDPPSAFARRRALLLPYGLAAITLAAWVVAGVLWGVVGPLVTGTFTPVRSARLLFGIGIGGLVTTAFIFFAAEHRWRKVLPAFFADGDLSAVRDTPRLGVRLRLLVVLLLLSLVPLSLLGVLAYASATELLRASRDVAGEIVGRLVPVILFIVGLGVISAIGLSAFVANSVATPLADVERAMAEVERGNLDQRCAFVANDEIGAVAAGFNRMVLGLRDRERIKDAFGKYVTPEIRDEILAGRVTLEGQAIEATILFADLRDFTAWVESTNPRDVLRDLNAYFSEMERAITGQGGLIFQFVGDEIEAVFGAPVPAVDHALRAVRAAVEMRRRLTTWNADRLRHGQSPFRHGVGIHTATVLAGNVGSRDRLSYALVGDGINVASRIQDLTKEVGNDILVSATTRARIDGGLRLERLPSMHVRGRSAEVEVYRLL